MKFATTTIKTPEFKLWKNGQLVAEFSTKQEMMEAYEALYDTIKNQGRLNKDVIEAIAYNSRRGGAKLCAANVYFGI